MQAVIKEAEQQPEVILFIDEIHTLVGTGAGGGSTMDAANILKPALARGSIRLIGATTTAEYRGANATDAPGQFLPCEGGALTARGVRGMVRA